MKIPPKHLYIPKDPELLQSPQADEIKVDNKEVGNTEQEEDKDEESSSYSTEDTLEELDYEDRKWLLFQLVLCNPIFLEEVMFGLPMSLIGDNDAVHKEPSGDGDEAIGLLNVQKSSGMIKDEILRFEEECEGADKSGNIPGKEDDPLLGMTDLSLGLNDENETRREKSKLSRVDEKKAKAGEGDGNESARLADTDKKAELLPILVPESEWLLAYCQIDAIPSFTRDTFLLNLCLISPTHSAILESFYSSLKSGRMKHEEYDSHPDKIEWKDRFNEANEGRRVLATPAMREEYGSVTYWEELGEDREGVWDVALCEIGGWLMWDLPCLIKPDRGQSQEVDDGTGKQTSTRAYEEASDIGDKNARERSSKGAEPEYDHQPEWGIAQDYIKMMAFIIQTKTLSLIRQITRSDYAADSLPGRYRHEALTINDMVKLSVFLTRSPLPLRKLLQDEMRSKSAETVILFDELEGAECGWVRVDDDLGWDLECIQRGLDDVGYGYLWEGVMTAWYEK